jgi:outer membrane protein OmpA-like peptidoglycan-associated protein
MKRWLVQNNIDEGRIETKGWGGARKLYDTKGSNADKNVRVEVEILTE